MRSITLVSALVYCISTAHGQSDQLPKDSTSLAAGLIGEWHFIHVLGPDGKPTEHIIRSQGPNGQTTTVVANGPDISIRADRTYEKRFAPDHKDTGYWSVGSANEVHYTMVVPMNSKQGEMLRLTEQMFNKTWPTDGKGNYLDTSSDQLIRLTEDEMRVIEEGYTFVYRKP